MNDIPELSPADRRGPDGRLVPVACAAWAGGLMVTAQPGSALLVGSVTGLAAALATALLVRSQRPTPGRGSRRRLVSRAPWGRHVHPGRDQVILLGLLALLGVAGVSTCTVFQSAVRYPTLLTQSDGRLVTAIVRVDSTPRPAQAGRFEREERVRFRSTATSLTAADRTVDTRAPVLVFAPAAAARVPIGSTLSVRGIVHVGDPGSSTSAVLFAADPPRVIASATLPETLADGLRSGLARLARDLPGDGGDLLPGLAIGDESAVSIGLDQAMKASSLSHLTAVSGANCAVVVAAGFLLARSVGLPRWGRVLCALTVLAGFVVLVTPSPSVVRAAVMAAIVLTAVGLGGLSRGLPVLCTCVIVMLIANPWWAGDYGFALSVLAAAGLLVLAPVLARALARWMPQWLAVGLSVPLAAQLACQPVLILLDAHVPLLGALANLLAEPAAPVATVLGLLACLLGAVLPPVAAILAALAWVPAAWIAAVARAVTAFPELRPAWEAGFSGAASAGVLIVLVLACVPGVVPTGRLRITLPRRLPTTRRRRVDPRSFPRSITVRTSLVRAGAGMVLVVLLVIAAAARTGADLGIALARPSGWLMAACDIGQGDAVLMRSPPVPTRPAAVALVDVGPDPAALSRCLNELGITRIDLLILTHYDADHVGGLAAVLGHVRVALVGRPTDAPDQALVGRLAAHGAEVHRGLSGDRGTLGMFAWHIVWPEPGRATMSAGNEGSVTAVFTAPGLSAAFLGDLDERAQTALLATGRVPTVDVVKVAHHGSADQSPALYARLRATIGLVSVGKGNDYGHPTRRLLGILDDIGTAVERTDLQGMMLVAPSKTGGLIIWSERAATSGQDDVPGGRPDRRAHGRRAHGG